MPSHSASWRSILILSFIYAWVPQVVSFPQVFPPKHCIRLSSLAYLLHSTPFSFIFITRTIVGEQYGSYNLKYETVITVIAGTRLLRIIPAIN
jgi:hypothetical protein